MVDISKRIEQQSVMDKLKDSQAHRRQSKGMKSRQHSKHGGDNVIDKGAKSESTKLISNELRSELKSVDDENDENQEKVKTTNERNKSVEKKMSRRKTMNHLELGLDVDEPKTDAENETKENSDKQQEDGDGDEKKQKPLPVHLSVKQYIEEWWLTAIHTLVGRSVSDFSTQETDSSTAAKGFPRILIVGTHRNAIHTEPITRDQVIAEVFAHIHNNLVDAHLNEYIHPEFIALVSFIHSVHHQGKKTMK